jgi:hypothetical protein
MRGFFAFDFAQRQNDNVKRTTAKADPYGMTNKRAGNSNGNRRSFDFTSRKVREMFRSG